MHYVDPQPLSISIFLLHTIEILVSNHQAGDFFITAPAPLHFLQGDVTLRVNLYTNITKNGHLDRVFGSHLINISLFVSIMWFYCTGLLGQS